MIKNYSLGIEDPDDEIAENPQKVTKEGDDDSLYWEDEDSANYSEDSTKKKTRGRRGGKNKKKMIKNKVKN